MSAESPARRALSVAEYHRGVRAGDRSVLARAVTLIESNLPAHQAKARELLQSLAPYTGGALRIGITGFPGAGKSSLIEALGCRLIAAGQKVAVLAIDPSSELSHGSILGDKTRMEQLARSEASFIRPSPSGGTLGGVARKTRETLLLCEAAGYDVVLVETVGVGQNETSVRNLVDFFLLVLIAGAGDELQGIKRGVMEMADALLLNKADGENLARTLRAQREFALGLKYLMPYTPGWQVPVLTASALEGSGLDALWETVQGFADQTRASGVFAAQRRAQRASWFEQLLEEAVLERFFAAAGRQAAYARLREQVATGERAALDAVNELLHARKEDHD